MNYSVEEVEGEKINNIVVRLKGEGISFLASSNMVSVYLDEKTADSIAWNIQCILQDRDRIKKEKEIS